MTFHEEKIVQVNSFPLGALGATVGSMALKESKSNPQLSLNFCIYSVRAETESTAFPGALLVQRGQSVPSKAVDLDYFLLLEHKHAGTYLNERSCHEEYES